MINNANYLTKRYVIMYVRDAVVVQSSISFNTPFICYARSHPSWVAFLFGGIR